MKIKQVSFAVLCGLSLSSQAVQLDEQEFNNGDDYLGDFYGSQEMVAIATGIQTQIFKAPAVASVITAQQIRAMGATDIDDVLETVPGLHVSRFANSYLPIYTFRGVHSTYNAQVLMLINGVPITNSFLGNRNQNWLGMPVETIARIEVIRGPGSALYGADAFAGVINIITKSAKDIKQSELALRSGSYNTQDAWISTATDIGEASLSLVAEYHKTDGLDKVIEADAQTILDKVYGTSASLAPGTLSLGVESVEIRTEMNWQQWTLRAGWQNRTNGGLGAGLGEALDPDANKASSRINVDVNFSDQISEHWLLDTQASYFQTSQDIKNNYTIYPAGVSFGGGKVYSNGFIGNPEVFERHYRLNFSGLYTGWENHALKLGAGYHLGDMYKTKESKNFGLNGQGEVIAPGSPLQDVSDTDYIFLKETDRSNTHLYVQDIWKLANDWELTSGLRHDYYSDFGSTTNPRLALVWSTSLNLSTKFMYGKAFRAPSFAELGNINNPVVLGNPNLKPESMQTFEMAFDYHPGSNFGAVLNFYRYQWSNIIQFTPDDNGVTKTAQNIGEQDGWGFEFELDWKLADNLRLAANFSNAKSVNALTDQDIAFVPGNQAYLQLDWKVSDEINAQLKSNVVMNRKRDLADPREAIDDYALTDLTLSWQPANLPLQAKLLVKNLFDEDAREPSINRGALVNLPNDLPLIGRMVLAEVRYQF